MTNPITLMAMQTAHPADMMSAGHSTKRPDVDGMIAAGMAAGMPRVSWCAVRWVWCNDGGMLEELRESLLSEAMGIQAREKWKDPDNIIVESFVDMALAEGGSFSHRTAIDGFGAIKTAADRYRWLGWHKSKWGRWQTKYEAVYLVLFGWTMDGYRHLWDAQRGDG
jgi:hypothetical protein